MYGIEQDDRNTRVARVGQCFGPAPPVGVGDVDAADDHDPDRPGHEIGNASPGGGPFRGGVGRIRCRRVGDLEPVVAQRVDDGPVRGGVARSHESHGRISGMYGIMGDLRQGVLGVADRAARRRAGTQRQHGRHAGHQSENPSCHVITISSDEQGHRYTSSKSFSS